MPLFQRLLELQEFQRDNARLHTAEGPEPLSGAGLRKWDKYTVAIGADRSLLHRQTVSYV